MLGTDEEYIGLVDAIISACYENVPDQSSILKIPYIQVFQSNQHQDGSLSYIGALHEYEYRNDDLNKGIVDVGVKILFFVANPGNAGSDCTIFSEQEFGNIIALYPEFQDIGTSITSSIPAIWESGSPGNLLKNYCIQTQVEIKKIMEGGKEIAYEDFINDGEGL